MPGITLGGVESAGGVIIGSQSVVTVNGSPVAVLGDAVAGHGKSPHSNASMVAGSSVMSINGVPVCRAGDAASCGHSASGQGWFTVD